MTRIDPRDGWPYEGEPFHPGELEMQTRTGLRERLQQVGPLIFRGAMPDEHRELFEQLPFIVLGALDGERRPWATILAGALGFVATPDERTLRIHALPAPQDPLAPVLRAGASVGLLGIELETRRRNRANGVLRGLDAGGLVVDVVQSFGNCPKYIQARHPVFTAAGADAHVATRFTKVLPAPAAALVERADTFFIASASAAAAEAEHAPNEGVDVSHRGGKPGFVRVREVEGHTVLTSPDFLGNFFFNTFGNLAVNPRAGLLFPDFERGDLLQMTGSARVIWDGPELRAFAGAKRLLEFRLDEGCWRPGALPLRATGVEYSPQLRATGSWQDVALKNK